MIIEILKSIVLGVIQGIAEFIPVSSSGHLLILRKLMDFGNTNFIDVVMHIPTLLVVFIVFRKTIARLFISLIRPVGLILRKQTLDQDTKTDLRLILIIITATIPTVILGVLFDQIEGIFEANPRYVSILFLITGIILIITRYLAKGEKDYNTIGIKEGIITGIAQGIGVLPGISRSGITVAGSRFCGIKQEKAGEFAFLVGIPAFLGAFIYKLKDPVVMDISLPALAAGLAVCFIVGLISLLILLKLIRTGKFYLFSLYLIPAGILTFIFV
jgi:undecaprenyl-diphosphatase